LIRNVKKLRLADIHSQLESRHVQISIPSFEFNSVTYLKESLQSVINFNLDDKYLIYALVALGEILKKSGCNWYEWLW